MRAQNIVIDETDLDPLFLFSPVNRERVRARNDVIDETVGVLTHADATAKLQKVAVLEMAGNGEDSAFDDFGEFIRRWKAHSQCLGPKGAVVSIHQFGLGAGSSLPGFFPWD